MSPHMTWLRGFPLAALDRKVFVCAEGSLQCSVASGCWHSRYDLDDPAGVFCDNFAPGETQLFRDASAYGANWEELQNAARSVLHGLTEANVALVGGDVASTTLVGRIDRLDGEVIAFDGRSQLGWPCTAGSWKIRQELNTAWIVEPQDIADTLGQRGSDR